MAVTAHISYTDGRIVMDLSPDEPREWIAKDPNDRDWEIYIYADHEKLERGEYEIVGIEAIDVSDLTDGELAALDQLALPRVDVPEAGLSNISVADALRWTRQTYPSRYTAART